MILLFNVCITPSSSSCNINYDRGLLPNFDKIDILKYCLASLSIIPWSEAVINIELQSYYKIFEKEIYNYVNDQFKNIKFVFSNKRAKNQKDWQKLNNLLSTKPDPLLWYCGNHDHIFMSPNLDVINLIENKLTNSPDYTYIIYSHQAEFHDSYVHDESFSFLNLPQLHAMCCLKVKDFNDFWSSFDLGDYFMPRTEWYILDKDKDKYISHIDWNVYSPHAKCCEHFDGYSHRIPISHFQPLIIPTGFFNKNIKIQFGGIRKNGFFYINCFKQHSCVREDGTDSYWSEEDIPLFWRDKLTKIIYNENYDKVEANKIKNNKYLNYLFYLSFKRFDQEFKTKMKMLLFGEDYDTFI